MPSRRSCLIALAAVAVAAIAIDRITKVWAVAVLQPRMALDGAGPIPVIGDFLQLTYTENTGAAWSIGAGYTWIFSIVAVAVAIVILRMARNLHSIGWSVALGGLLGGLLGNLIDRMTRPPGPGMGSVVDFVWLRSIDFPVFNVADMFITCSAVFMVVLSLCGIDYRGAQPVEPEQ